MFSESMLYYLLICIPHIVLCLLFYLCVISFKAFKVVNRLSIQNWKIIRVYYLSKITIIIIWSTGYFSLIFIFWILDRSEYVLTANSIPVSLGIALDLYFTYCIYSCYLLGIRGSFAIQPALGINPNEIFTIRKAENVSQSVVHQCENIKEIIAYPESKFLCRDIKQNMHQNNGDYTIIDKNVIHQIDID